MIKILQIKNLALNSLKKDGSIDKKISDFVLDNLTKKELKIYLKTLKRINRENKVVIFSDGVLNSIIKKEIETMYSHKNLEFKTDKNLKGGVMIIDNDMIVNYTIDGLIKNRIIQI